jgi:glycine/D-amino acid oxidase-like deaminating enzyme
MSSREADPDEDAPPSVAVVGAGAVGLTTARDLAGHNLAGHNLAGYDLAGHDLDVTVFERGEPGDGASGRAAGVLYDAYAEDVDAALGGRAIERFRAFSGTGGFQFHECPYVMLARDGDDEQAEAIETAAERMRANGRDVETLTPETLGERFSSLETDDIAAAAVTPNAGWTDTASYIDAMATAAAEAGVTIRTNTPVETVGANTVQTADGTEEFDAILVAAGAHTKRLLAPDIEVALKPYRVQALTSETADEPPHDGPMWYDASVGVYARPHPTGLLAGDGTVPEEADPDEWDREADDWFIEDTATVLAHRLRAPDAASEITDERLERAWAGLCTATPDGDPLLGKLRDGLYVAAGWQGHGFMRSPAHAELLAELIASDLGVSEADPASVPGGAVAVEEFDPTRFPEGVAFEVREGMVIEER